MRYLVLAAMTILPACVPYHSHDAPHVAGRVVNSVTGQPIAAATVAMSADPAWDGRGRTVRTHTDTHGYFSLPEIDHWFVAPLSDGIVDGEGTLSVEAPGYRPHREKRTLSTETLSIPLAPKT